MRTYTFTITDENGHAVNYFGFDLLKAAWRSRSKQMSTLRKQRDEARNEARKYYKKWQETEGGLAMCEDSASYEAKRAKVELKEAQEHLAETHALAKKYHKLYKEKQCVWTPIDKRFEVG